MIPIWAQLGYLLAAVCFILALKGLSHSRTALLGNRLAAAGALVAVVVPFCHLDLKNVWLILLAIVIGTAIAVFGAQRTKVTQLPQLSALLNGLGGGATALIGLLGLAEILDRQSAAPGRDLYGWFVYFALAAAILIGAVALAAALVGFARSRGQIGTVVFPGLPIVVAVAILAALVLGVLSIVNPALWTGIVLAVLGLIIGALLALPIGATDGAIVTALLTALTGVGVAAIGYVLGNILLLIAGTLLTIRLARGRSFPRTLIAAMRGQHDDAASGQSVRSTTAQEVASLLTSADRVIVVPGYGLAAAQAQYALRELGDVLTRRGAEVSYAIHPVAGRMPGHLNVLLDDANVPHEQLREMDSVDFADADLVLVVGANDVVNPAVLSTGIAEAKQLVVLKRSMHPGFSGLDNDLLLAPATALLFGDAKETVTALSEHSRRQG